MLYGMIETRLIILIVTDDVNLPIELDGHFWSATRHRCHLSLAVGAVLKVIGL